MSNWFRGLPTAVDYALMILGLVLYFPLVISVMYIPSPFWAVVIAFIVGPVLFFAVSYREGRSFRDTFSPEIQAWSLLSDALLLPFAFWILAHAYQTTDAGSLSIPFVVTGLFAVAAILIGKVFHEGDRKAYAAEGFGDDVVDSNGKVYHDLVVTPVYVAVLPWVFIRMLEPERGWPWNWNWSTSAWFVLVIGLIWGLLVLSDRASEGKIPWGHVSRDSYPAQTPQPQGTDRDEDPATATS